MIEIRIENDCDTENPLDCDQFVLHSFSTRHYNFKHPEELGIQRDGSCSEIGLRRKIECGTAWVLGYYEHGDCVWFLKGETPPGCACRFDGVEVAGVLVWEGKPKDLSDTPEKRTEIARSMLEVYTEWCNGQCYWYSLDKVDEHGVEIEHIDSCGGYIGTDHLFSCLRDEHGELFENLTDDDVEFTGLASDLVDLSDLQKQSA